MSNFIKRLFSKSKIDKDINITKSIIEESNNSIFLSFINKYNELINLDTFISRKHYTQELSSYYEDLRKVSIYLENGLFTEYCNKNNLKINEVEEALTIYNNLDENIKSHNNDFIEKKLVEDKEYFDDILKADDPKIILDKEQREVILNDEDNCLVIAGAGAGKTTTIAAKVKYLVDKKNIDPKKILVISFTNKAVNELKDRINNKLKIDCPVTTFHACGNAIINKTQDSKLNIATDGAMYNILKNYITTNIFTDKLALKSLILFFGYYIDIPLESDKLEDYLEYNKHSDFSTLRSNLGEINKQIINSRKKTLETINNEIVKSLDEVQIANFLYLNGIDYEYEKPYPYHIPNAIKIYTPDFYLIQGNKEYYLEHFGISEDGKSSRYSELELTRYKGQIAD